MTKFPKIHQIQSSKRKKTSYQHFKPSPPCQEREAQPERVENQSQKELIAVQLIEIN